MGRKEEGKEKYRALFGEQQPAALLTDPEFQDILSSFVFGEVYEQGGLDDQTRELIALVVLTVNQALPQLRVHVEAALNTGLKSEAVKEAVYQCAPYIGFPKTLCALETVNEVFQAQGVALPLEPQAQTNECNRLEKGLAVQKAIFGEVIDQMRTNAPEGQQHIQDYLSAFCFGDFYTRAGLDLKTRELLTFCIISALGGCESQVKSHVQGNLNVGNSREVLVAAITQCLPYVGFPRALNALSCINEVLKGQEVEE